MSCIYASYASTIEGGTVHHSTSILTPRRQVYMCLGESIYFICQISPVNAQTVTLIQWRIQFDSLSVHDISETFRHPYYVGAILRDSIHHGNDEVEFIFNLTFASSYKLESTLSTDVYQFFNGALVQCGEDHAYFASTVIYTIQGTQR